MKTSYETITGNESFDFNELKTVAKELNESGLAPKKINMVGCKKEEAVKRFLDAIEKIPDEDVQKMPDMVFELNNTFIDILDKNDGEEEKEEEVEEGKGEVTEVSKKEEKGKITSKAKERKAYTISLIERANLPQPKVVKMVMEKFPEIKKSTINTAITDWKNPKYCPRDVKLVVKGDNDILSFKEG